MSNNVGLSGKLLLSKYISVLYVVQNKIYHCYVKIKQTVTLNYAAANEKIKISILQEAWEEYKNKQCTQKPHFS